MVCCPEVCYTTRTVYVRWDKGWFIMVDDHRELNTQQQLENRWITRSVDIFPTYWAASKWSARGLWCPVLYVTIHQALESSTVYVWVDPCAGGALDSGLSPEYRWWWGRPLCRRDCVTTLKKFVSKLFFVFIIKLWLKGRITMHIWVYFKFRNLFLKKLTE